MRFLVTLVGSLPQPDWLIDRSTPEVESPQTAVRRIEKALRCVEPENVILAPACGMKFLPRTAALGRMRAMTGTARLLRRRYA